MASCPVCGFDPTSVSPPDAVVALRSLPRRFRAVVDPPTADDGDGDGDPTAAPADVAGALAHAATAAAQIAAIGEGLRLVLVEDTPVLPPLHEDAPRTSGDALSALAAAATSVADLAASQPATAWTRTGRRGGADVSAADLLREAVHAGVHQLRLAAGGAAESPR